MARDERESKGEAVQPVVAMTPEQIAELLKAIKSDDDDLLKKKADYDAQAMKRVLKPENETHPGISVYNPLGERDHPKPKLACAAYWVGYDLREDNLTPEEITLLNALVEQTITDGFPHVDDQGKACAKYDCQRTDGSPLMVTVYAVRDGARLNKIDVQFPCRGEQKFNLPSMSALLRQMLNVMEPKQAEALAEIARLRKELAALSR